MVAAVLPEKSKTPQDYVDQSGRVKTIRVPAMDQHPKPDPNTYLLPLPRSKYCKEAGRYLKMNIASPVSTAATEFTPLGASVLICSAVTLVKS